MRRGVDPPPPRPGRVPSRQMVWVLAVLVLLAAAVLILRNRPNP